jgi:hypothetical protein
MGACLVQAWTEVVEIKQVKNRDCRVAIAPRNDNKDDVIAVVIASEAKQSPILDNPEGEWASQTPICIQWFFSALTE